MRTLTITVFCIILICVFVACKRDHTQQATLLFDYIDVKKAGISFENNLPYSEQVNCYLFKNYYNGGGVAVADVNSDGLIDVFFCGNRASNRLYLNRGEFKFEDVTERAGLLSEGAWTTGASFVDVNGDALLDLYVCRSGPPDLPNRKNQLFINQGDGTFQDKAHEYGVDVLGLAAHAVFFDYDHDGDQDFYLLSNSLRSVGGYDLQAGQRTVRDPQGANRFFRNDGNTFTDVSAEVGVYGSNIGFGLGVAVGDYNRDGWQDMFISNDFFERDYLYKNTGKSTFAELGDLAMPEMSMGSMGADIADINNDLYPDIYVTEMLPSTYQRYKTKVQFDNWNKFALMQASGYHHQYGRNVLQINDQKGGFQEIGRLAGVEATDWSWGALLADFDNDGWKDIFVANGVGKDLLDQDYIAFNADRQAVYRRLVDNGKGIVGLIDQIPSEPQPNMLFRNLGGHYPTFSEIGKQAGITQPTYSNGSVYTDLDNDGDLDLIVNNLDAPPTLMRNNTDGSKSWLTVTCKGDAPNHFGLGAQVVIKSKSGRQFHEVSPMRGFQSCADPRLHFGLGTDQIIDTLWCVFPARHGQTTRGIVKTQVAVNQTLTLNESEAIAGVTLPRNEAMPTEDHKPITNAITAFKHEQGYEGDFDREPLLFHMYSASGPAVAIGDVNHDQLDDCFIGGGVGQAGRVFIQSKDGTWREMPQPDFGSHAASNDAAAQFLDADQDGDLDLYVGSGCNGDPAGHPSLADRIYFNDGRGRFLHKPDALPGSKPFGTAWVLTTDFNNDHSLDLLVGMRAVNGQYGAQAGIFALLNDGKGRFEPEPQRLQYDTDRNRMSTAAQLADMDKDGDMDLVAVFDWGAPVIMLNDGQGMYKQKPDTLLATHTGWWSSVHICDLNQDGKLDFITGNHGLNSRFKASAAKPLVLHLNDLDQNGTKDPILTMFFGGNAFPFAQRSDLVKQIPILKKQILKSDSYAQMTLAQLEAKLPRPNSDRDSLRAITLHSMAWINIGDGIFMPKVLPNEAQLAPIYSAINLDAKNLLLGGNQLFAKPECGGQLASRGVQMRMDLGKWIISEPFALSGNTRNLAILKGHQHRYLLATRTDQTPLMYQIK